MNQVVRPATVTTPDFSAIKTRQQAAWSSGDYAVVGTTLQIVGETLCEAVDLRAGSHVLDVAAGNGNATLAAARRFADVVSTDYVGALLERGRERAEAEHLSVAFQEADAENLPFPDQSFDAVINVESSHLYPNFPRFLDEVARVLRPGGHFLYADLRFADTIVHWETQLAESQLSMIYCATINEQVMQGMEMNSQWWVRVVDRLVPKFLRRWLLVRGYMIVWNAFRDMRSGGSTDYRLYCFTNA